MPHAIHILGTNGPCRRLFKREVHMMPVHSAPYPAEKARGGEIILREPWQRGIFILGLVLPLIILLMVISLR